MARKIISNTLAKFVSSKPFSTHIPITYKSQTAIYIYGYVDIWRGGEYERQEKSLIHQFQVLDWGKTIDVNSLENGEHQMTNTNRLSLTLISLLIVECMFKTDRCAIFAWRLARISNSAITVFNKPIPRVPHRFWTSCSFSILMAQLSDTVQFSERTITRPIAGPFLVSGNWDTEITWLSEN